MAHYLVKVTDTYRSNGEYEGGHSLAEARKEARWFAEQPELANATVRIVKVVQGDKIKTVEYIRERDTRLPYSDSGDNPMSKASHPRPEPGYAFVAHHNADWEEWDIEVVTASDLKGARYVGTRTIDGTRVNVWHIKGGRYAAQTAFGHNPIPTAGKVAIGAGLVAILAAIFWPKSASAAEAPPTPTPTPTPGQPSPTPPPSPAPTDPPPTPPPAPAPAPDPKSPAPDVASKLGPPVNATFGGTVVIWQWKSDSEGSGWQQVFTQQVPFVPGAPIDLSLFASLYPGYQANPTNLPGIPKMCAQLYEWDGASWSIRSPGSFCNYDTTKVTKASGWTWVRTWMWSTTGWVIANDTGAQPSGPYIDPAQLAAAVKQISAPPYYSQQVFRWNGTAWVFAAQAQNY